MEQNQVKQHAWVHDGLRSTVTYVRQSRMTVDEVGLRKALKARVFDQYTKKVLDKAALEKAMEAGEVDPHIVAQYTTLTEGKPFVRFTEKEIDRAED